MVIRITNYFVYTFLHEFGHLVFFDEAARNNAYDTMEKLCTKNSKLIRHHRSESENHYACGFMYHNLTITELNADLFATLKIKNVIESLRITSNQELAVLDQIH